MVNVILIIILLAIPTGIILYLRQAKKNGATCIGCPHGKKCSGGCSGHCHHSES